jgi:hypothetical protein
MRTPTTHPLNVSYLVVGLVFLGLSGSWALHTAGIVDNRDVGWLLPLVLVTAGTVGLVAFAAKGVRRNRRHDDGDLDPGTVLDAPTYDLYPASTDDLADHGDRTEGDYR